MKKTIFLLALILFFVIPTQEGSAQQVTVQDDAKVGVIVTGTGNVINTTQIFGKSPEYAELKKRLDGLQAAIAKKADECEQMAKDSLPAKYRDACRAELIALNAERDSVQKIETRFREDVIRLAETFSKIELNSERLQLAKQFFDEGKIREADKVLNAKEIKQEGDALLAKKERAEQALQETDSLLRIKADELALKAHLKATDYADPLRYDTATLYFEQSCRYAETVDNLWNFAHILISDNRADLAFNYYEKAVNAARDEVEEAALAMNLGVSYRAIGKIEDAERMYLRAFQIYKRLAFSNSMLYEPNLATISMNLGNFYREINKNEASERMYLYSIEISERLAMSNPTGYGAICAQRMVDVATFYSEIQKMNDANKIFLRSLEIFKQMEKSGALEVNSEDMAVLARAFGSYYSSIGLIQAAEEMYVQSLDLYERLDKVRPVKFELEIAKTAQNLANLYSAANKNVEAETMYLRSLEIIERWAKNNPLQFEPFLAVATMNLGSFFFKTKKISEGENMYRRSLEIRERLAKSNPEVHEPNLAEVYSNLCIFYREGDNTLEAEKMCLHSVSIYEKLAKTNSSVFEVKLAKMAVELGIVYYSTNKMQEAETILRRALEIQERLVQVNQTKPNEDIARTLEVLAVVYFFSQKKEDAEKMFEHALEVRELLTKADSAQYEQDLAFLLSNMGAFFMLQGQLVKASQFYERSLLLRQKAMMAGQLQFLDDLKVPYSQLLDLRDSFELRQDWGMVIKIQSIRASCVESLIRTNEALTPNALEEYGLLSRYCLLDKKYPEAQSSAERVLALDSFQNSARTNLGHSYLLRGEWDKAKATYEEYLKNEADPSAAKATLLQDWDDLEKAGAIPKERMGDVEKARKWVKG